MSSFPTSSPPGSLVKSKLDELFWEWLCLPESQKLVRQAILAGKGGPGVREDALTQLEHSGPSSSFPSPHFSSSGTPRSPTGRPSPTGSPDLRNVPRGPGASVSVGDGGGSVSSGPSSRQTPGGPAQRDLQRGALDSLGDDPHILDAHHVPPPTSALPLRVPPPTSLKSGAGAKEIPRFFFPRRNFPTKVLCPEATRRIREFCKQLPARPGGGAKGIITEKDMEPFVLNVLGVSKYFAAPVLQKMKVHFGLSEEKEAWTMEGVLAPSSVPLTEELVTEYCTGRIQIDDPVLTFFWMVKKDHADWIEREDFRIFMNAVLMKHPGLDFLQETAEFQDRYANTVISRIFFVYDRRDTGRIELKSLRRHKPCVVDIWRQLADHDDIKVVRDYFSYEHFYDMISPTVEGCFTMLDFKRRRKFAGTFFSIFLSLNKFLAFEHRDPFQQKQEQVQTPGMSDWDRWCQREYLRLAMEEGEEAEEEPNNDGFIDGGVLARLGG
jgi:hypothetical protein